MMIKDVFGNKSFGYLVLAQILSKMSDRILLIGISWYLIKNFNTHILAIFFAIVMLPYMVGVFFSGKLINRFSAVCIIKYSECFRGIVYIVLAGLYFLNFTGSISVLIIAVFLANFATALFNPAVLTAPREIFQNGRLLQSCLGSLDTCNSLASIIGPIIAVPLYGFFGIGGLIFICGALYLLAWIGELRIKVNVQSLPDAVQTHWLKHPYAILKKHPLITLLLLIFFLTNLFVIPLQVFLPVLAKSVYDGGVKLLSFFEVAIAVGALLGGLFISFRSFFDKPWQKISIPYFLFSMGYIWMSQSHTPLSAALGLFIMGFFLAIGNVTTLTFFQTHADHAHSADIMAYVSFISTASGPIAMGLVGLLIAGLQIKFLIAAYAIATLVATSLLMLSGRYRSLEK